MKPCKPCGNRPQKGRNTFSRYCLPPNGARCISSTKWAEKYHYSKDQIKTLARKKLVRGFHHKGVFYVEDRPPYDGFGVIQS